MKIQQLFNSGAILIGSRQWGGANIESDYDVVISDSEFNKIIETIKHPERLSTVTYDDNIFLTKNNYNYTSNDGVINVMTFSNNIPYVKIYNNINKVFEQRNKLNKAERFELHKLLFNTTLKEIQNGDR